MEQTYVVFIQMGDDGPVRIAQSKNPDYALEKTQQYHYEDLFLVASIEGQGGYAVQHLKAALEKEDLGRSWYQPSNRLLALIKHIQNTEENDLYAYVTEKFYGRKVKRRGPGRKSKASKIKIDKSKVKDRLQREIEAGTLSVRRLDDDAAAD